MSKYLSFFSDYLQNHQVMIVSTSLTGYQDISGFSGIQLHDDFSTLFFYNYCLFLSKKQKSIRYLLFLKPNQFLFPISFSTTSGDTIKSSLLQILSSQNTVDNAITSSDSPSSIVSSFKLTKKSKEKEKKAFSLRTRPSALNNSTRCSFYLKSKVYGISEDLNGAFSNPYGPSDYFFFKGE
jgi:hypothetical protein